MKTKRVAPGVHQGHIRGHWVGFEKEDRGWTVWKTSETVETGLSGTLYWPTLKAAKRAVETLGYGP
jgi:hypothetical protein